MTTVDTQPSADRGWTDAAILIALAVQFSVQSLSYIYRYVLINFVDMGIWGEYLMFLLYFVSGATTIIIAITIKHQVMRVVGIVLASLLMLMSMGANIYWLVQYSSF